MIRTTRVSLPGRRPPSAMPRPLRPDSLPGAPRPLPAPVPAAHQGPLEIWGGVECTINRVGNERLSQLEFNGHLHRESDLDAIAGLGLRTLRFPVLWEQHVQAPDAAIDWTWIDRRLARARELGIRPIVGLVHHGSGPLHAPMGSERFAPELARYAAQVVARHPWIDAFTPVNEPLTTARFAGLYGLWFPHGRDATTFAACLMTEIEATVQAMAAIRRINPAARLVQTDDLGYAWSTPRLASVAAFENERRWLGWDLLCGRVDREHYFHRWLRDAGISTSRLDRLVAEPCPPDVVGINHYVTSERFLDERVHLYRGRRRRVDGPVPFVDTEAVRVMQSPSPGLGARLHEAWRRYGLPLAVTEVHLGCTREEQVRWLRDCHRGALDARERGADVRALTVWALLGSHDWCSLLTEKRGRYESGAFDVRGGAPRITALGEAVRELAIGGRVPSHPALQGEGWWRRPIRLVHRPTQAVQPVAPEGWSGQGARILTGGGLDARGTSTAPLLVIGATGTLGGWFARLCKLRGLSHLVVARDKVDIGEPESVARILDSVKPWAVVNCAGYVRVDDAERDRDACFRANATGPALLARGCAERGIRFATFSSDLVFDGSRSTPYEEGASAAPLNVYGESKLEAERRVLDHLPEALVVRTSAFFSPTDRWNFLRVAMDVMKRGEDFRAAADQTVSPTYVPDLVNVTLDLLLDGEGGLIHLANVGEITWAQLAARAAEIAGADPGRVVACESRELGLVAKRPAYSVLQSARRSAMPSLEDALERFKVDFKRAA